MADPHPREKQPEGALMAIKAVRPADAGPVTPGIARRFIRHENALLFLVLVALIVAMGIVTGGKTVSKANAINILLQSSIRGVASVGVAFVILCAGIDVSIGGIGLFAAVLGASLMTDSFMNIVGTPIPVGLVIPIMLLVGAGWGALNGTAISRIGMPPLIVTLAMWEVTKGLAFQIGGGQSIGGQPDALAFIGSGDLLGIPVPVIIFALTALIAYFVLRYTTFGRSVYAVGGNPTSAWLSGIKVKRIQLLVYVIAGFLAGLAGIIMTGRVMSASMVTLSGLEMDSIAAVTVGGVSLSGGKGNLIGVIIGVLIIGVINNSMSILGAGPSVQGIVKGTIIFSAVAVDYIRRA
jgi:ribose/xylose/arabinose/galactoside ABC-type transport system permease subunit